MKLISKITLMILFLISFSCSKEDTTSTNIGFLDKVAIVSNDLLTVEANLIDTNPNLYTIEVRITNKETKESLPTFIHKFIPDNKIEIMKDLPTKINSFNGTFIIEVEGQILHKSIIKNGIVKESEIKKFEISEFARISYPCTVDGITSCADDQINDMNWIEYGFCLASAPACLAELYLSCGWENC